MNKNSLCRFALPLSHISTNSLLFRPAPPSLGVDPPFSVARLFYHGGSCSVIHPPRMPINWGFHGTGSVQEVFGIVRGVSDLPLGISK